MSRTWRQKQTGFAAGALLMAGIVMMCPLFAKQAAAEEEEAAVVIGEEKDGQEPVKILNHTGKDIVYLAVKDGSMVAFPGNLFADGQALGDEQTGLLYYDWEAAEAPCLIGIMFDGDAHEQAILCAAPFGKADQWTMLLDGEANTFGSDRVAYVTYEADGSGEMSTREAENTAYENGETMFILPWPEENSRDADEGCIGDEGLFN